MRIAVGLSLALALTAMAQSATKKRAAPVVTSGEKTPGVLIPFASLKAEVELPIAPPWTFASDSLLIPNPGAGTLAPLDPKTNKLGDAIAGLRKPCCSVANGFTSLWVPSCTTQSLGRIDPKTWKITASVLSGIGSATPAVAATADSVWLLGDDRTTLSRIDPD
jgi:virginiamycin B lyase